MESTMEVNNSIFQTLNCIGKKLKDSKLSEELLMEFSSSIKTVANYLGTTYEQALMFAILFRINCNNAKSDTDLGDVASYLDVDLMDLLVYQKDLEYMVECQLLAKELNRNRSKIKLMNFDYYIPTVLFDAILMNAPVPDKAIVSEIERYSFVNKVSNLLEERKRENIETWELFSNVATLEADNPQLSLVVELKKSVQNIDDRTFFYEICDDLIANEGRTGIDYTLTDIYDNVRQRLRKSREIMDKKNQLIELDLVELVEGGFFSDAGIALTDKGKALFLGEDADLFLKKSKANNLIHPEAIAAKSLFFDEELNRQVSFLQQSLEQSSFVNLQNRMEEKALPKGVAAIFYGSPGTGKTETVYQLAKQTGRAILHVDISQSKSMWFGESEKKIKEIFTNYKKLCKSEEMKPILLFNEADAIFGRRKDGNASNVAQTENAMQNIILEEMEKLDGILIATTNLNQNLDAAFERRFLFKVEFTKPTAEAKQKIWQSKLPWMKDEEAQSLAARYSFSGGEIDNIVRKATMEEVLNGSTPNFPQIITFCDGEKFSGKGTVRLGF